MKRISIILSFLFLFQIVYASKPNKAIYFPNETKKVFGITFVKVGVGTKKEIKNNTFQSYYISTSKVSRRQFAYFLNDIKAEYELAGIYKNDICLLSDFRYVGKGPVSWDYNSKKNEWTYTPKPLANEPAGMVTILGANQFCHWLQQETGENVRLPKPIEYRPTLPQNIKKYIRKNKKSLSIEDIDLIKSLNIENLSTGTEWAQYTPGSAYIMSYSKDCPKGLYIPMLLLSCTGVAAPITIPILAFVKIPKLKFTSLYSSNENSTFPTAEPDLGFRLVIPAPNYWDD